jgi:zinc transport system substrate-binding protein
MKHLMYYTSLCLLSLIFNIGGAVAKPVETVFVSLLPQRFFMQQICKDSVAIEVMVEPGANPHTYEPKPSQMKKLASSRAYFAVGISFEDSWLEKFTGVNPNLKVVHTDTGIDKLTMADHHDEDGQPEEDLHGEAHHAEDHHGGPDPHIWLSPALVKKQAETMKNALTGLFPDKDAFFQANLDAFIKEIDVLDAHLRALLRGKEGMRFMVFHPSWGYFARDYGLEQVAVEVAGKEPKPHQLRQLIELAREQNIHVIFTQPQFSAKSARLLAKEISGEVLPLDSLAEDWLTNMRLVAESLRTTVK